MSNSRIVAQDTIHGGFLLPIGLRLGSREVGEHIPALWVSTVQLDGAHLEDPFGIVDPETGFETMVFFEGMRLFGLYREHYKSRRAAVSGHRRVVAAIKAKKLPLAIVIDNYWIRDEAVAA